MGDLLAADIGCVPVTAGHPAPPLCANWDVELDAARPQLLTLSHRFDAIFAAAGVPVMAAGRCAASLATLPVVARRRPDAVIVWCDAHGDCNTPATTKSGYLGGLVLTGAAGVWDSGLGGGLDLSRVILVGARDLDAAEYDRIESSGITLLPVDPDLPARLRAAIAGRPVYLHLDCDVLEPGLLPLELPVPEGLSLVQLATVCAVLAEGELVGLEIAECEAHRAEDIVAAKRVVESLQSLVQKLNR